MPWSLSKHVLKKVWLKFGGGRPPRGGTLSPTQQMTVVSSSRKLHFDRMIATCGRANDFGKPRLSMCETMLFGRARENMCASARMRASGVGSAPRRTRRSRTITSSLPRLPPRSSRARPSSGPRSSTSQAKASCWAVPPNVDGVSQLPNGDGPEGAAGAAAPGGDVLPPPAARRACAARRRRSAFSTQSFVDKPADVIRALSSFMDMASTSFASADMLPSYATVTPSSCPRSN